MLSEGVVGGTIPGKKIFAEDLNNLNPKKT